MFSSITSYLWGTSEPEQPVDEAEARQTSETKDVPTEEPMSEEKCANNDKDWVLVNVKDVFGTHLHGHTTCVTHLHDEKMSRSGSDWESLNGSPKIRASPDSLSPVRQCRYSPCSNHSQSSEGWLITPPPCFNSGNNEATEVEIGPMENLLIEHPSMSVYNHGSMVHSGSEDSNQSDTSTDVVPRKLRSRKSQVATRQGPGRPRLISAKAELLQQIDSVKNAQRVEKYNKTRRVSRKNLNKMNHLHEVQSVGKVHGRRNRVRCPSGQMCGRVSQRKH